MRRVLVLHGPNLNRLGLRETHIYGHVTLDEINERLIALGKTLDVECECRQSNSEGQLIDWVHEAADSHDGMIVNFGAYSHTSLALADALRSVDVPAVEVHVSHVVAREAIRKTLLTAAACVGMVSGFGPRTYLLGFEALIGYLNEQTAQSAHTISTEES